MTVCVCVCVCVCLLVCTLAYLQNHTAELRQIFVCMLMLNVAMSRYESRGDITIRYLLPVLRMTSRSDVMGLAGDRIAQ